MKHQLFDITSRTLDVSGHSSMVIAEVTGEIDVSCANGFAEAIHAITEPGPLIVDLSGLTYIDSAGFAALEGLLRQRGIAIVVEPHSPIHAAANLIDLPCHATIADAQQAIRGAGH
jgi:anti-anti-sigma factor